MTFKSQKKGKAGELAVVKILRVAFPECRRRAQEEAQAGNLAATAATLGRDLAGTPGFCVQVQLAKTPTIEKKFEEAFAARGHGEVSVAVTRRSSRKASGPWLATLPAQDFAKLVADRDRAQRTALALGEDALRYKNQAEELASELGRKTFEPRDV